MREALAGLGPLLEIDQLLALVGGGAVAVLVVCVGGTCPGWSWHSIAIV